MRISWMELSQVAVSVMAAFAFDRYQAAVDPLPTTQSWLIWVLFVGIGAAWLYTQVIVRLADYAARWSRRRRQGAPEGLAGRPLSRTGH